MQRDGLVCSIWQGKLAMQRWSYAWQVTPVRLTYTVCHKTTLIIATSDIGVNSISSYHQTHDTIEKTYIGMCEVRWTGAGLATSYNYTVIYPGYDTHTKMGWNYDGRRKIIMPTTILDRLGSHLCGETQWQAIYRKHRIHVCTDVYKADEERVTFVGTLN